MRENQNAGSQNADLKDGSHGTDYLPYLSDLRATWQRVWESEIGTVVQNDFETVTKHYVVDYLSPANRDILVTEDGSFTQRYVYDAEGKRLSVELGYADGTARGATNTNGEYGENPQSDAAASIGKAWYRTSHLNSTLFAVEADGSVVAHMIYDPFGKPLLETYTDTNYSGLDNLNNFTGYTWDEVLGLYFAQNRFYDAAAHRFTQEDAVKDGGNWYAYCGNDPLNYVDLAGFEKIVVSGNHGIRYATANFLEPAIRAIKEWLRTGNCIESITWLIADRGYSDSADNFSDSLLAVLYRLYEDYPDSFDDHTVKVTAAGIELTLKDGIHKLSIKMIGSKKDLKNHFISGLNRDNEKISEMVVFSHAVAGQLSLGYQAFNGLRGSLNISVDDLDKWKDSISSAFAEDYFCVLYACNTGTERNGKSFAQEWANVTGGYVIGLAGLPNSITPNNAKTTYRYIDEGRKYSRFSSRWSEFWLGAEYYLDGSWYYPQMSKDNPGQWNIYQANKAPINAESIMNISERKLTLPTLDDIKSLIR